MQRNMKIYFTQRKKQSIETVPEEGQILYLVDKDFYNMFKDLRETKPQ